MRLLRLWRSGLLRVPASARKPVQLSNYKRSPRLPLQLWEGLKVSGPKIGLSRRNSFDISKAENQSGMCEFDPSHGSQPFPRSARLPERRENGPEIPAFRALASSLGSRCVRLESEIASGLVREYSRFPETVGGDWFDHSGEIGNENDLFLARRSERNRLKRPTREAADNRARELKDLGWLSR